MQGGDDPDSIFGSEGHPLEAPSETPLKTAVPDLSSVPLVEVLGQETGKAANTPFANALRRAADNSEDPAGAVNGWSPAF